MLNEIINAFKNVDDKRVAGRTKYPLYQLLTIFFIANLLGINQWIKIYHFVERNVDWLKKCIPGFIPIPGVDTIARTLSKSIDPGQLTSVIGKLTLALLRRNKKTRKPGRPHKNSEPEIISIDGKTLKGAAIPGDNKSKIHIINVIIDLAFRFQQKVADKTNEIPTVPIILNTLHKLRMLTGRLISLDAMGCQRATVDLIHKCKAFYLINLKGNQSGLLEQVKSIFDIGLSKHKDEFDFRTYESGCDKGHGRIDKRSITVVYLKDQAFEWLSKAQDWAGLKTVVQVTRTQDVPDKDRKGEYKTIIESRYFICSQSYLPKQMLKYVIKHWEVETFHLYLDKAHNEDQCKVYSSNGPEVYSLMRKFSLNFILPLSRKLARTSVTTLFDKFKFDLDFLKYVLENDPDDVIASLNNKNK
jgi:predicted transposase YbfD/YdcC